MALFNDVWGKSSSPFEKAPYLVQKKITLVSVWDCSAVVSINLVFSSKALLSFSSGKYAELLLHI